MSEIDSEEWVLMTLGSYITLTDGVDNGVIPLDTPIFVYEAFGSIPVLNGWGMGSGTTDIGGFTIIFNGRTGDLMESTAYPQENLALQSYGLNLSSIPEANVRPQTPMAIPTMIFMPPPDLKVTAEATMEVTQ